MGNKSFVINNLYSSILLSFILIFILALSITVQLNSSLTKTTKILKLHPKKASAHNIKSIRYSSILAVGKELAKNIVPAIDGFGLMRDRNQITAIGQSPLSRWLSTHAR